MADESSALKAVFARARVEDWPPRDYERYYAERSPADVLADAALMARALRELVDARDRGTKTKVRNPVLAAYVARVLKKNPRVGGAALWERLPAWSKHQPGAKVEAVKLGGDDVAGIWRDVDTNEIVTALISQWTGELIDGERPARLGRHQLYRYINLARASR